MPNISVHKVIACVICNEAHIENRFHASDCDFGSRRRDHGRSIARLMKEMLQVRFLMLANTCTRNKLD